ncbi:glucose-6-phosphate isomerase [Thermanaerovibrio velox DSM 12556]|uniref:Glucose-6-phosphate isomerase n=1 Tax=Thermanaerovibrio velox DSM 12556 TaxID=926567 RepID=H0UQZ1_9BACT|nr:glucose-6-phosphate isomerase [Thermanaerovibrio velox]EHM09820.1 glucose-6-phosphate isomerase [Thermanaerovibrio velox DSM 12556]
MGSSLKFALGAVWGKDLPSGEVLSSLKSRVLSAFHDLVNRKDPSWLGWMDLPDQEVDGVMEAADWLRGFDAFVQVGIGGSALGNLMLHQALIGDIEMKTAKPCFYLADNPDPMKLQEMWKDLEGRRFALVGVSKSGSTAETTSQFMWFLDKLKGSYDSVLLITDPEGGIFRKFVNETGCRSLPLRSDVGGRYSVLSPVGLLSAAALGIPVDQLLEGARAMRDGLISQGDFDRNPAMRLAACHLYHEISQRPMAVMMPYSSRLERFSEWFAQLWGESLGKEGRGTTPIRALGAIDQHSQVQLYMEGPDDKFFTIIDVAFPQDVAIPQASSEALKSLDYLAGKGLGEMLRKEAMATASALAGAGRPVMWIQMERLDPRSLGELIFFYQFTTAITGLAMGVNPFDQPGVEQGKRYTYGLMGRPGFEEEAERAERAFDVISSEVL